VDHALSQVFLLVIKDHHHNLIIDDMIYIANVGDSRALMSADGGKYVVALSRDHKPNDDAEQKRIVEGGGRIYQ